MICSLFIYPVCRYNSFANAVLSEAEIPEETREIR